MPYTILVVDDDKKYIDDFRSHFYDYDVVEAPTVESALGLLKRPNEVDIIVLDAVISRMDSIHLLPEIKKYADPNASVIILADDASEDILLRALRVHADDFIQKTLNVREVRKIINGSLINNGAQADKMMDGTLSSRIKMAKSFIMKNYQKNLTLKDVASVVCMCPKYLSRRFKEVTGMSFSHYKVHARIEKAKELLSKTSMTIKGIADKVGYNNSESFIRMFEKLLGSTPTEYRKRYRSK